MSDLDYEAMAAGKPSMPTKVKGSIRPIHDRVIVKHMNFGEQKTAGGIIITSDDGKDRGIKPRWGQVVSKGNTNNCLTRAFCLVLQLGLVTFLPSRTLR